jgi:hypothetical protein
MNKLMILSGVALLGLAGGAIAQAPGQGPRRAVDVTRAEVIQHSDAAFARLDANHDGRFTREEAEALGQQRRERMQTRMFERLDADHNGQLSFQEWAASTLRKFADADANHDRALNRAEFAATAPRPRRTASAARCDCTNQRSAAIGGGRGPVTARRAAVREEASAGEDES